jgi:hypothetical protein
MQQAILKKGAANPALMVLRTGTHPKKLQELASIKDPVKFAVAVGKLETEVKVTKRSQHQTRARDDGEEHQAPHRIVQGNP